MEQAGKKSWTGPTLLLNIAKDLLNTANSDKGLQIDLLNITKNDKGLGIIP